MAAPSYMSGFWTSILTDKKVQEHLRFVLNINDPEERAMQVVCHTLFLFVMDMKKERDEAFKKMSETSDRVTVCQKCKKGLSSDEVSDDKIKKKVLRNDETKGATSSDVDAACTKGRKDKQKAECEDIQTVTQVEDSDESSDVIPNSPALKSQKKRDKSYRSLSRISPKMDAEVNTDAVCKKNIPAVLVLETLSLDEHELHVNVEKRKGFTTTQTVVVVPETLAVDTYTAVDHYGNSDFFESSFETETITKNKKGSYGRKDAAELNTPVKDQIISVDPDIEQSPILRKQNNTTPKSSKPSNFKIPLSFDFESSVKEPLQPLSVNMPSKGKAPQIMCTLDINTEDIREGNIVPQETSTQRYSPLVFTHNLSSSMNDLEHTSPSLLPTLCAKNNGSKLDEKPSTSFVVPRKVPNLVVARPKKKSRSLKKSSSTFNADPAKENTTRVLRRCRTDNNPVKGRLYEVSVEPTDTSKRRKYKQTRISEMLLVPKIDIAKLTGGVPKLTCDDKVSAALEASLKTKKTDDMMRKKHKELKSEYPLKTVPHSVAAVQDSQNTEIVRNKHGKCEPKFKSPKKPSCRTLDAEPSSPSKKGNKSSRKSPLSSPKQSPQKKISSPRKKNKANEIEKSNPVKKRRLDSSKKDDEMFEFDELLDQVNDSLLESVSEKGTGKRTSRTMSPQKASSKGSSTENNSEKEVVAKNVPNEMVNKGGVCSQKNKLAKKVFKKSKTYDDSFDVVPVQDDDLGYAYKGDVVRKKAARKHLEGWNCHECKDWYEGAGIDPDRKKALMNKCSRHRSKHSPVTNTPKNFWDPDWIDDSDDWS